MDTIGLDLHKRESQLCVLTEAGEVIERRIQTSRERFTTVLGDRPRARILVEDSTESEWVARHLEALGHEVILADPNFAPMYARCRRGVKTDRRDARTLAEACRLGAYRPVHRASARQRHVRAQLVVRDALIRTRTRYVNVVRALTRREGLRLATGGPEHLGAQAGGAAARAGAGGRTGPAARGARAGERRDRARRRAARGHRGGRSPRRAAAHGARDRARDRGGVCRDAG